MADLGIGVVGAAGRMGAAIVREATETNGCAIVAACEKEAKQRGITRLGVEGQSGSSWVLLDYGDLIVHLFLPEQREYYALEHLWADAERVR